MIILFSLPLVAIYLLMILAASITGQMGIYGFFFLGIVAVLPWLAQQFTDVQALTLSSTGLLIVVGVVLDTIRQLEAQLLMRNYRGFIR